MARGNFVEKRVTRANWPSSSTKSSEPQRPTVSSHSQSRQQGLGQRIEVAVTMGRGSLLQQRIGQTQLVFGHMFLGKESRTFCSHRECKSGRGNV